MATIWNAGRVFLFAGVLATAAVINPDPVAWVQGAGLGEPAEARVGRPATPASAAGVARRTTRRVVTRTTVYVAALPAGCTTVSVNGAPLYSCGGVYYQASGGQYVVVQVD